MEETQIVIDISGVLIKVEILSSHVGKNSYGSDGVDLYESTHITSQDKPLIDTFISKAILNLTHLFGGYFYCHRESDIILTTPPFFNSHLKQQLSDSVLQYIVNATFAEWLTHIGSAKLSQYVGSANDNFSNVKKYFYTKRAPSRNSSPPLPPTQ